MQTRFIRGVISAITWLMLGMVFMARFYCDHLGITSGTMYIGWDTVLVVLGGLSAMHLLMWLDPSFR